MINKILCRNIIFFGPIADTNDDYYSYVFGLPVCIKGIGFEKISAGTGNPVNIRLVLVEEEE